jgi:GNAT superfamily N-acetyltransferase
VATVADAEQVADLSRRAFYDTFAEQNTKEDIDIFMDKQFARERLITEVGAPGNTFLLAHADGELAGYAFLCETPVPPELAGARAIEIGRFYAEKHMVGKGIGKALMQKSLETAREMGKEWIWLGVWEHNRRAIAFYTRWGFEKFGEHIFVVGHDPQTDWWMKRRI